MPIEADIIHLKKNPVRLGILNIFKQNLWNLSYSE